MKGMALQRGKTLRLLEQGQGEMGDPQGQGGIGGPRAQCL